MTTEDKRTFTIEQFREWGKKGGKKTLEMHGKIHFSKAVKAKKRISTTTPLKKKGKRNTI